MLVAIRLDVVSGEMERSLGRSFLGGQRAGIGQRGERYEGEESGVWVGRVYRGICESVGDCDIDR